MKIIYTIAGTYRPAGMERVLSGKARCLSEAGHEVIIVTTEQKGRPSAFPLPSNVRCIDLGIGYEDNNGSSLFDKIIHYPALQRRHKKALKELLEYEKADIVVSMFCGDERFLTGFKDGSRKVLEIHFSRYKRLQYGRKGLWALADRIRNSIDTIIAKRFDAFVVLTEEDRGYWGKMGNIHVIPNARTFTFDSPSALENHTVIAVGRYSPQKALDRLLVAWAKLDRGDWTLKLVGDGEDRESLEKLARELGIASSVRFGRSVGDMREVYSNASILALSSLYEGLPMVLLEAQAAGMPAVAFECKCGPRDVITDGVDGYLVPEGDTNTFAERLGALMTDSDLRHRMGAAAFAASERFDENTVMAQWYTLFTSLKNA